MGSDAKKLAVGFVAALVLLTVGTGPTTAQSCQCAPSEFAGNCKATVTHQEGLNALRVTSDTKACSFVEWTYKDGSKDSEVVAGGVAHKVTLFDLTKPKPAITAMRCNVCGTGAADLKTGEPRMTVDAKPAGSAPPPPANLLAEEMKRQLQQEFASGDKIQTGEPRMTVDAKPVVPSTGNVAEDMKRSLQQEFAAKTTEPGKENWDDVLAKVEQGNKQFAEQQRLAAIRRQQEEEARRAQEEADRLEREAQLAEEQFYSEPEPEPQGPNLLDMLNAINREVQRETAASKRRLDQTIANAEAQAARERAQRAREEANRLAQENQRRMQELQNQQRQAQQQMAMRQQNADQTRANEQQRRLEEQQRQQQLAHQQREQQLALQRQEEQARREEERARQEAERQRKEAEARQRAEEQRMAALRREEEANRPVAWKEGVTLCREERPNYWRCEGPLQLTFADFRSKNWRVDVGDACGGGAASVRDLGTSSGFRVFGCGFGIHPTDRNYPGNRDIPAQFGVYVADRGVYMCSRKVDAYCRSR